MIAPWTDMPFPAAPEPRLIVPNMQCGRGQGKKDRNFRAENRTSMRAFNAYATLL